MKNDNTKDILISISEKLGKVEANTDTLVKDNVLIKEEQKVIKTQVISNSMKIKFIYGGLSIIFIGIIGTIFEWWKKILGR